MTRRQTFATVAVVVVAALVGAAVWWFTGDDVDAKRAWVSSADTSCQQLIDSIAGVDIPQADNREQVDAWASQMADLYTEHIAQLEAIRAEPGAQGLAEDVVSEARTQRSYYEQIAAGGEAPDPTQEEPGANDETLGVSLTRVDELTEPYGGERCGAALLAGTVSDPLANPVTAWIDGIEAICFEQNQVVADADDRLGSSSIDAPTYYSELAAAMEELNTRIAEYGAPPANAALTGAYEAVLAGSAAVRDAAFANDAAAVSAAADTWVGQADPERLPACSQGVVAGEDTPSGEIVAPDVPTPLGDGISDDGITDAGIVVSYTMAWLLDYAGANPDNTFGIRGLVGDVIGGGVSAADGNIEADPTSVSVSRAVPADPNAEPGPANPWIVGIAVSDTDGGCAYGWLAGWPRLYTYDMVAVNGACTGDAALEAAPREFDDA